MQKPELVYVTVCYNSLVKQLFIWFVRNNFSFETTVLLPNFTGKHRTHRRSNIIAFVCNHNEREIINCKDYLLVLVIRTVNPCLIHLCRPIHVRFFSIISWKHNKAVFLNALTNSLSCIYMANYCIFSVIFSRLSIWHWNSSTYQQQLGYVDSGVKTAFLKLSLHCFKIWCNNNSQVNGIKTDFSM